MHSVPLSNWIAALLFQNVDLVLPNQSGIELGLPVLSHVWIPTSLQIQTFQSPFTSGDPVMVSQVFTVPRRLTGFSGYCSFKICWILQQFYIVLHGECSLCTIQVFSRVSCSTIFCLPPLRIMSSLPVSCCLNMVDRELWLPVTLPLMFLLGWCSIFVICRWARVSQSLSILLHRLLMATWRRLECHNSSNSPASWNQVIHTLDFILLCRQVV